MVAVQDSGGDGARVRGGGFRTFAARALRGRCPQCGGGRLFLRFARLAERCAGCGLVFRREQGAQTGSMYLTAAVNQAFAALFVAGIYLLTDWGVARSLAVSVPLVLLFSLAFLPVSMAFWVAVEYWTDVRNGEPWVAPRGS